MASDLFQRNRSGGASPCPRPMYVQTNNGMPRRSCRYQGFLSLAKVPCDTPLDFPASRYSISFGYRFLISPSGRSQSITHNCGHTRGYPSRWRSITSSRSVLTFGKMGRSASLGMPSRDANERSRMKKSFAPVAIPRDTKNKSPSRTTSESSLSETLGMVHLVSDASSSTETVWVNSGRLRVPPDVIVTMSPEVGDVF